MNQRPKYNTGRQSGNISKHGHRQWLLEQDNKSAHKKRKARQIKPRNFFTAK